LLEVAAEAKILPAAAVVAELFIMEVIQLLPDLLTRLLLAVVALDLIATKQPTAATANLTD
jgi:hypothetical protein